MRQSRGAGFLEYALILVLIALAVIGAVVLLGPQIVGNPGGGVIQALFIHLQ